MTPFHPPQRTLMGPGPSDVHPRVLAAMARPTIGHLDPEFIRMMDEIKALLRYAFRTQNELTFPVSAPGSAGMETCLVNLIEPEDKVVVAVNGVFGRRMAAIVERAGGQPLLVEDPWGAPVDPQKVEDQLKKTGAKAVAFVHAETSTGVESDAKSIAEIAHGHDALAIADCVTSLGGIPVEVDAWGLDAVYSGSQKCLSCTPGLSPVTFSERAVAALKARKHPVQSWFLDLSLVMGYWGDGGQRSYHHTAPINALYGLHESLVMLKEEGLETAWKRHREHHLALLAGLEGLGVTPTVPEAHRLPQLNAVAVPSGVDDKTVRRQILDEWNLEIGGGLGDFAGKIWRIGLMGCAANAVNVRRCVAALGAVLNRR